MLFKTVFSSSKDNNQDINMHLFFFFFFIIGKGAEDIVDNILCEWLEKYRKKCCRYKS